MPTISFFFGIVIRMYWRDHEPPHFHALYGSDVVLINIETLEVIQGTVPQRALSLIREWAALHKSDLMEDWNLCKQKKLPRKIAPLE